MTHGEPHLKIHKVTPGKYAVFTTSGDYIDTVPYDEVKPLLLHPKERAEYLKRYSKKVADSS